MFEIGNSLRGARLRREVDLALAEQATKIRGKYLRALEDEQFDLLPSQTYVKGFLRTYAEYLGLDGQLYVDEYNSRFVAGEELHLRPRRSDVRPQRRNRRSETTTVLLALAGIAVVLVVLISAWKSGGHAPRKPAVTRRAAVAPRVHPRAPLLMLTAKYAARAIVHDGSPSGRLRFENTIERGKTLPLNGTRLWLSLPSPEAFRIKVAGRLVHPRAGRPLNAIVTRAGIRPAT